MVDQQESGTSYNHIFKTTFVFGFVQVFKAIIAIARNKIVAVLIGTEGMGLISIFASTTSMIKTGAGLGLDQSAVRDVSEAYGSNERAKYSRIINVTTRVVLLTGLLGMLVTIIMSHWLSIWTLGGTEYTISYCFLGIGVFLDIMNDGRQALLKGTRQLKSLAYASIIGSFVALLTSVPLFYILGKEGIVPALLIASACALLVSEYFLRKIDFDKLKISFNETIKTAKPMLVMGSAMMLMTLLQAVVALIIQAFIRSKGGLNDVGLYGAGNAILQSYFGIIITALMTDYYPRIAAVNSNNEKLQDELIKQSKISLLMCGPLFVVFMSFLPFFVQFLFSKDFLPATDYIGFAIYYTLITVCSNQVDMILVAKFKVSTFTILSVIIRCVQLLLCISLYSLCGLKGLGVATLLLGVFHYLTMTTVVYRLYKIKFDKTFYRLAAVILLFALASSGISYFHSLTIRYSIGVVLSIASLSYSYVISQRVLGVNFKSVIKSKISRDN